MNKAIAFIGLVSIFITLLLLPFIIHTFEYRDFGGDPSYSQKVDPRSKSVEIRQIAYRVIREGG